jgi:hypothetical protein
MSHRILKFTGKYHRYFDVRLPKKATVLSVQSQLDMPVLWAEVDTTIPKEDYVVRSFTSFATGEEIDNLGNCTYIDTLQDNHGYVWHFYEVCR